MLHIFRLGVVGVFFASGFLFFGFDLELEMLLFIYSHWPFH